MTAGRPLDLDVLTLAVGRHADTQRAMSVVEAAAYVAGEPWSDRPACISPLIAAFLRSWNDALDDVTRNRLLKCFVLKAIGTNTAAAHEVTRAWLVTDWLVREQAPAWLALAGLTKDAARLRALPALTSSDIAVAIQPALTGAREHAAAVWDGAETAEGIAAWKAAATASRSFAAAAARSAAISAAGVDGQAAAWDTTWDAARDVAETVAEAVAWDLADAAAWDVIDTVAQRAAGDAAEAAEGEVTWDAARHAAWAAAWAAAWTAARAAARRAAWPAAREAARRAARDAGSQDMDVVRAAESAAEDAALERLAPTVYALQTSAVALLERLCAVSA